MGELGEIAPFLQTGAAGILLAVVWWLIRVVVRGDFVPRRTIVMLLEGKDSEIDRAIKRGDEYRDAWETERNSSEILRGQNGELIQVARTFEHVMESLKIAAERKAPNVE